MASADTSGTPSRIQQRSQQMSRRFGQNLDSEPFYEWRIEANTAETLKRNLVGLNVADRPERRLHARNSSNGQTRLLD